MSDLLAFEDAQAQVAAAFSALPAVEIPIENALGMVLAEPVVSKIDQPPHPVSAMDGYAVRSADGTMPLNCVGESAAGHPYKSGVKSGECVRIFTGAYVPESADAILIQENAERQGNLVQPSEETPEGRFIRPKGLDFSVGKTIEAGTQINARVQSLIAAMNIATVQVHRRPRVAILSSGDEIMLPGSDLKAGQIASSNHIAIASLVRQAGGEPTFLGIAPDHLPDIIALLEQAKSFDLLITSGGASVGDHDLMKPAFEAVGAELDFKKIAMKPGKPMIFGRLGTSSEATRVLGLPGNPVSAYITALIFAFPAIRSMLGHQNTALATVEAKLTHPLVANGPRREFRRVKLSQNADQAWLCTPFTNQDSSMLSRLAEADGLLNVAPFAPEQAADTPVTVSQFP